MDVVIVTGLSGAGKSQAIGCLEDQGYYCIDNMPHSLIGDFIKLANLKGANITKAAFVIDIRSVEFIEDLKTTLDGLGDIVGKRKIIFLEADDNILIRRYNETRRKHPLKNKSPDTKDINQEREYMADIRSMSDFIIDTSKMKTSTLHNELISILQDDKKEESFVINISSFGFKNGLPVSSDMIFDVRFIPNPYYISSLKKFTGNNKKVSNYVMNNVQTELFVKNVLKLINDTIPFYMKEGKFHLNLAFGCTGGRHRSVAVANEFYRVFELQGREVTLEHRDLNK